MAKSSRPTGKPASAGAEPVEGEREIAAELAADAPEGVTINVSTDAAGEMTEQADPANPPSGGGPYCMATHKDAPDSPCQRAPHAGVDGRHYHPNLGWW